MQTTVVAFAVFLVLTVSCARASAQEAAPDQPSRTHTGKLAGKITDDSGKAVNDATAVLTDSETRDAVSAKSDGKGKYEFAKLFPGSYSVRAEKENRKSDAVELKISNGNTTTVDLKLTSQ
jgi:uncharacterized GH25 family protein